MNWRLVVLGAAVAAASHVAVIVAAPYVFMRGAMKRVSRDGTSINKLNHGQRVSEQSRRVVRPSPDLDTDFLLYVLNGPLGRQQAIEAAVSDTLIYRFLTQKCGVSEDKAASALLDFRELRQGSRETVYPS